MLTLHAITKHFGNTLALDRADLIVRSSTVHALLGANGAGKTTLMRIAYGMMSPDSGTIEIEGVARRIASPRDAIAAGIGMVHQHYALVPEMTVAENIALGGTGRYEPRAAASRVRAIASTTGLTLDPATRVGDLSVAAQQRVEIAKALARDARLLILDEPTAVLPPETAADLLAWLGRFAAGGGTVVLITHKLREALEVANDVTVLRDGRTVLAAPAAGLTEDRLAEAMIGRTTPALTAGRVHRAVMTTAPHAGVVTASHQGPAVHAAPVFSASHLSLADARGTVVVADATLAIHAGEIVGIAAIEGQGQHELLRALAGRHPVAAGELVIPDDVGFVPEDRSRDALMLEFPLYENVALRRAGRRSGLVSWSAFRLATRMLIETFDIRAEGADARAGTLSGGNQQKLVLGRELAPSAGPRAPSAPALVIENPTRGLDIGATATVQQRLRDARDAGAAIVLYASDLDEVLPLADRVLVLANGTLRELPVDRDAVGRAMLGLVRE